MKNACLLIGALIVTACGGAAKPAPAPTPPSAPAPAEPASAAPEHDETSEAPSTDPAEGKRLVEEEGAVLIDVRTAEEYDARHIKSAKRVGVDEVADRTDDIAEMAGGKDKPIVVYCGSGRRASRAQEALEEAGFSSVTNLGGIDDWDCSTDDCHEGSETAD